MLHIDTKVGLTISNKMWIFESTAIETLYHVYMLYLNDVEGSSKMFEDLNN